MTIFNQIFDAPFVMLMAKLLLAMLLGLILGLERIYAHKTAGMRTYALVALTSAGFISVSLYIGNTFTQFSNAFNPAFIAGYIIMGIGFLGGGLILHRDGHIENLTTAAGIWACAGIGIMCGFGMFKEAIFISLLIFFVMAFMSVVERSIRLKFYPDPEFEKSLQPKVLEVTLAKPRTRKPKVKKIEVSEE